MDRISEQLGVPGVGFVTTWGVLLPASVLASDWYAAFTLWVGSYPLIFTGLSVLHCYRRCTLAARDSAPSSRFGRPPRRGPCDRDGSQAPVAQSPARTRGQPVGLRRPCCDDGPAQSAAKPRPHDVTGAR